MAKIILENLKKTYQYDIDVISKFNLEIDDGEIVVLLGNSGCGKTTILNMIEGSEEITSGDIYINDIRVNDINPSHRNVKYISSEETLIPNKTIYDNMLLALKPYRLNRNETSDRINKMADLLDITYYLERKPQQLSQAQRLRVQLAMALICQPSVLLLDDPFLMLDKSPAFQASMRNEFRKIVKKLGITTIFATGDSLVGLSIADRIAVMKNGVLEQVGTPKEVYQRPVNRFVSNITGSYPRTNFIKATLENGRVIIGKQKYTLNPYQTEILSNCDIREILLAVRPEDITIDGYSSTLEAQVNTIEFYGSYSVVNFYLEGQECCLKNTSFNLEPEGTIRVGFLVDKVHVYDSIKEEIIV